MNKSWEFIQEKYEHSQNKKYETLFTLANGYRGLRGKLGYSDFGEKGNYISGVFDKLEGQVTELVNCQNPMGLNIYLEDEKVNLDYSKIIFFERKLNMKEGVLYLHTILETPKKRRVEISEERFVSRGNIHRWGAKYKIKSINFSGRLYIDSFIDGSTANSETKHYKVIQMEKLNTGIVLISETLEKKIKIAEATHVCIDNKFNVPNEEVREMLEKNIKANEVFVVEKYGCTFTSRDTGEDLKRAIEKELKDYIQVGYEKEKLLSIKKWNEIWEDIDIKIDGDEDAQLGLRFNLFHLSSSAYECNGSVSIGAKALHGEGYRGHIFWDTEIYMLPFYIYTQPQTAKSLLMYRYNMLHGARLNAKTKGYKGARFPWESADDGTEATPEYGIDFDGSLIKIYTGEEEYHINSDITFAIWEYFKVSQDIDFMQEFGLEIFLDTLKFWESCVQYDAGQDRYVINKVIGPDEFHEHVDNNAYTNYLVKWSMKKTLDLAAWMREKDELKLNDLCRKLDIGERNFKKWLDIEQKIYIPKGKDGRLIEEFQGYFDLKYIPIKSRDEYGMPMWPELNGLKLKDTQLIKQADVILLVLMLNNEFDQQTLKENYEFYEKRTMHKSSLSPSIYSIMGHRAGNDVNSYNYFMKTLMTDIDDNQGNTSMGIHAAAMGGSWQSAVFGFGGISTDEDGVLNINPHLPEKWNRLSFVIFYRNNRISITIAKDNIIMNTEHEISAKIYDKIYDLKSVDTIINMVNN